VKLRVTQRRKGWDHRLLLIPALAIGVGIMAGATSLKQKLLLAHCPSGTFVAGVATLDQERETVAFVAGAVVISWLLWAVLVRLWGTLPRSRSNKDAGWLWFKLKIETSNQKLLFIGGPLALAALLFFGPIFLSHPRFCLADEGIFIHSPWSDDLQHYAWNSVVRIDTDCQHGARGSWRTSFMVTMRDGSDFDLMTSGRNAARHYPRIVRKLQDVNFVFNYAGIEYCEAPLKDLVIRRP
jgi:MFS family permease